MRIAYVCTDPGVPVFGRKGCSVHVQEVIKGLLAEGATVELFAARIGGEAPSGLENITVKKLPSAPKSDTEERERFLLGVNPEIKQMLEEAGEFSAIYERHSLWSFAAMEYAQQCNIPGLLEVNAPLLEEQSQHRTLVLKHEAEQAVVKSFNAASALLAVSEIVADYLDGYVTSNRHIHVVPNGVDSTRFSLKQVAAMPAKDGQFTIGFVGSIKPWHDVETLIEAFAGLVKEDTRMRLLIVGDGPNLNNLENKAADLNVASSVLFTGSVDPSEVPSLLTSMDVAVAPYPDMEGFYFSPLKMFEYMAAGRAIVAADIGQISDFISDGVTGLLYPPGDSFALTMALQRLKDDSTLRRQLGQAARHTAVRNHSWVSVAKRILEIAKQQSKPDSLILKGC